MNRIKFFLVALFTLFILTILMSSRSNDNLNDFLVGHWTFDDEENFETDNSPFGAHGEVNGNPRKAAGIVGDGCLELDGDGDFLEVTKNGQTPEHLQTLEFGSVAIWFKARNIPKETSISPLFHYGNSLGCENMKDASNEGMVIEIAHGKIRKESLGVYFTMFNNPCELPTFCFDTHSEPHLEDTKGLIIEGKWYHFVAVVGENYNTGYLNGEEVDFRHYNFNDSSASQFFKNALSHERIWIGKGFWDYAKETYFDGYIDDVRIYSIPLNAKNVKSLYDLRN